MEGWRSEDEKMEAKVEVGDKGGRGKEELKALLRNF